MTCKREHIQRGEASAEMGQAVRNHSVRTQIEVLVLGSGKGLA